LTGVFGEVFKYSREVFVTTLFTGHYLAAMQHTAGYMHNS